MEAKTSPCVKDFNNFGLILCSVWENEHEKYPFFLRCDITMYNSAFPNLLTDGTAETPFPGGDVGGDAAPFCVVEDLRLRFDGTAGVYDGVRASMKPELS